MFSERFLLTCYEFLPKMPDARAHGIVGQKGGAMKQPTRVQGPAATPPQQLKERG